MNLEAPALPGTSLQIEDFRGDFPEVAALIQESWRENGKQGLLYTPEFLASCLSYPGSNSFLAPTLYHGDKPCAFVAGFPRNVQFKGRKLRLILCTLLSVSTEYKKSGYGVILWTELVKRARAAGFDGMLNYCVDGEPMNDMILGCCRMLKLPTARVFSVRYLMRLLQPRPAGSHIPHPHDSTGTFLEALALLGDEIPLKRLWSEDEARWLLHRSGGFVAHHRVGDREGLLTGYLMRAANSQRTKCLLIEDVLWGTLREDERPTLVERMLAQSASAGAQMAILPCLGYAADQPFRVARFRTSPRTLHCYLTVFDGDPAPEPLPSIYMDVV